MCSQLGQITAGQAYMTVILLIHSRCYPKTHPIMSRWVYALTFLRSVLGIKSGDSFKLKCCLSGL